MKQDRSGRRRVATVRTAAVRELQGEGKGVSEAVNELIRRGMLVEPRRAPFTPRTQPLGLKIDVSNVAEALDLLEGPTAR